MAVENEGSFASHENMKTGLLILASLVLYAALGTVLFLASAPIDFYASELRVWLANRVGDYWATLISGILAIAVGIPVMILIIGTPIVLLIWYGKRNRTSR